MVTTSLKSFIKSVKASKTLADERAVVQRESALVRTAFKDAHVSHQTRRVNISKLLYLYILGEKTHFGQVECINLLASPNFVDKRLGYLATMLILDENQEVLTLLTNSLNNDMNHPNQFIIALALSTLGNICSPALARDLYTDVEKVLAGSNNYLKKKAALVASIIVDKDPDLSGVFESKLGLLLDCPDHGVLLGTLRLVRSLYEESPELRPGLIQRVPRIVDTLKSLVKDQSPEFSVSGVADPFLQVSLLKTLRLIFSDTENAGLLAPYNESLHDVLTHVASYTVFPSASGAQTKSAGASVHYETVKTIFSLPNLDPALKVLGINTLGQLLATKDNNNRYVALSTLLTVVEIEPLAVQRHRSIIVQCLSDQDVSIKRRALELSFAILDSGNIRILVKEILTFLEAPVNNDAELKTYITSNVANILEHNELIPNEKWRFDTLARLAKISGDTFSSKISSQLLALIMNITDGELKGYTVNKLFKAAYEDNSKEGLNFMVVYLVGEYGDLLLNSTLNEEKKITDLLLVNYLVGLSHLKNDEPSLVSYILTAALKLSIKVSDSVAKTKLKSYIGSKTKSDDLNVQIKAATYSVLFDEPDSVKRGVLDRIPPPVIKQKDTISLTNRGKVLNTGSNARGKVTSTTEDLLLDLMDDDSTPTNNPATAQDLLGDIFGNSAPIQHKSSTNTDIMDLFGSSAPVPIAKASGQKPSGVEAFQNDRVKVSFMSKSIGNGQAIAETILENNTGDEISDLHLLIAVPKTQKLTMSSISSPVIAGFGTVTQDLKIVGASGSKVKLRVKFSYDVGGVSYTEQFDFAQFDGVL